MAWESWYQYESHTPNVLNPAAQLLSLTNANGAICNNASELTCNAPDWATVNDVSPQLGKKDALIFRNEYVNDEKGQRTGFKTKYTEHGISWNHWIGTMLVFRPELRFDRAFDAPAYDSGTKKNQFILAADMIWFYYPVVAHGLVRAVSTIMSTPRSYEHTGRYSVAPLRS
jgi:hypothetical protein